jgi:hypothetical protein
MSLSRQESHVWVDYFRDNTHVTLVICHATALAFVTKMSGKCQARSLSAIRVKNWQKTVSSEGKLDIIIQLEKGRHNVRLAHSSICTVHYNANRIKQSAKSGTKVCIKTTFQFLYLETCGVRKWGKTKEEGGAQIVVSSLTRGTPLPPCPHSVSTFQVSRNGNWTVPQSYQN